MEMTLYAPRKAHVKELHAGPQTQVEAGDLLAWLG
jgi:biotin carboxyl carrier protein